MFQPARIGLSALLLTAAGCGSDQSTPAGSAGTPPGTEDPVVHFANFTAEIGPDTLAEFTQETGIKVVYDVYDSNTTLEAKLFTGNTGYDIVVPGEQLPGEPGQGRRLPAARPVAAAQLEAPGSDNSAAGGAQRSR